MLGAAWEKLGEGVESTWSGWENQLGVFEKLKEGIEGKNGGRGERIDHCGEQRVFISFWLKWEGFWACE